MSRPGCCCLQGSDYSRLLQWAAFFADCEHELSPITKGLRLVLVYNLVGVGPPAAAAAVVSAGGLEVLPGSSISSAGRRERLEQAVQAWLAYMAAGGRKKRIAFLLGELRHKQV